MSLARSLALVLLGWVAALAQPIAGAASPACRPDRVLFERAGQLWLLDPGADPRPVARGGCGALSPGGRQLAYCAPSAARQDAPVDRLVLRDLEGSKERTLLTAPPGGRVLEVAWEPSGERIAVATADDQAATHVLVVDTRSGEGREVRFERADGAQMVWGLNWAAADRRLVVHDMRFVYRIGLEGPATERVPIPEITGAGLETVTSSDRFVYSPVDPTVVAFTRSVPGTARFEAVTHEPNTALFLHDRWLGRGKNLRLTAQDVTAFDPVWSPDGAFLYFTGYRDRQAKETDPFRILRVSRGGQELTEVARGEKPSVARSPANPCDPARGATARRGQ